MAGSTRWRCTDQIIELGAADYVFGFFISIYVRLGVQNPHIALSVQFTLLCLECVNERGTVPMA